MSTNALETDVIEENRRAAASDFAEPPQPFKPSPAAVVAAKTELKLSMGEAKRKALKDLLKDELGKPEADIRRVLLTLVEQL